MSGVKTVRFASLCALAAISGLVGTGWSLHAGARQGRTRPFIPRPSELRPLSRSQPPAVPQPASLPGGKPVSSQGSPAPSPPNDQKQKMADLDLQDPNVDEKTGITTGRDCIYKEDDMTVTGAKARYNKNTRVLEADGNLVLDDPKHHITGDKARYDNRASAKIAIITGSVVIVMKPKDKPTSDSTGDVAKEKNNGATIYCDRLDYFRKKDFVVLTGHLVFKQKITKENGHTVERTMTADHAEYDGKTDKMHLFAPVDGKDTDNQEAHFDHDVFVGTKEGAETMDSKGRGTLKILIENDDTEGQPEQNSADKTPANGGKSQDPPPTGTDNKQGPPAKKVP